MVFCGHMCRATRMTIPTITIKHNVKDGARNVLRVLGVVLILAAVVWVGMQSFRVGSPVRGIVANALSGLQSFFDPAERIVLFMTDSQAVIGEPFVVTWEHRGKDSEGSYAFAYECRDGIHLSLATDSRDDATVFCNVPTPILDTDTTLTMTARGTVAGAVEVPVRVEYVENGTTIVTQLGILNVSVQEKRFDTATSTDDGTTPTTGGTTPGQTTTTVTNIGTFPALTGKADFTVNFLAVGTVKSDGTDFEEEDELPRSPGSGRRAAIQFEVKNEGTNVSDEYRFDVQLPTSPSYTYKSPTQDALFPGDRIVFTVGFTKVRNANEDDFRIRVDIDDDTDESRENNNTEEGTIEIDR